MFVEMLNGSGGGSQTIDYNYVKNIVDSHAHTYEMTPYSGRTKVNEGGIYVDTTNHVVYMYADYDAATTQSVSSWTAAVQATPTGSNLFDLAPYSSNSYGSKIVNIHSTTATNDPTINLYPYNSNTLITGHLKKFTTGENFKVWAIWSVRTAI